MEKSTVEWGTEKANVVEWGIEKATVEWTVEW